VQRTGFFDANAFILLFIFILLLDFSQAVTEVVAGNFLLLRHNTRKMPRSPRETRLANDLRGLAQWVQLLETSEKVPMAGAKRLFPCQFYPLEERLHHE
jgi:hypothetical protein